MQRHIFYILFYDFFAFVVAISTSVCKCLVHASLNTCSEKRKLLFRALSRMAYASSGERSNALPKASTNSATVDA